MKTLTYKVIDGNSKGYLALLAILGLFVLAGAVAFFYMEHNGHWVTGMNDQVVWGIPHVFAVFLIVSASGALNVASISSVFNRKVYKPLAPLSAVLAITLLLGGLTILVLDLGRPDRLIVAMTKYNFKSIFAWNMLLYNGFLAIVGVYLWFMLERKMNQYSRYAGFAAFFWRLILTTGTGAIFGFLVSRQAYDVAIMAPMFIIMSFAYGLAIFNIVTIASYSWTNRQLGDVIFERLRKLLGIFIGAVFYFVTVYHLTKLYATKHHGVENFILLHGGVYTDLFWLGQVVIGMLIPAILVFHPALAKSRRALVTASALVIVGGISQMYVTIIGGQAYPMVMFPGKIVESSFFDGGIKSYIPSLPEFALAFGGFALSLIMVALAIKILRLLPESLSDAEIAPHHKA